MLVSGTLYDLALVLCDSRHLAYLSHPAVALHGIFQDVRGEINCAVDTLAFVKLVY